MTLRLVSFLAYKIYSGIIFQTSIEDAQRIFLAISVSSFTLGLLNFVSYYFTTDYILPFSILLIDYFVTIFLLTSYRAMVKILYLELHNSKKDKRRVAIYGADSAGVITKQTLDRDQGTNYQVIAFFDNDSTLRKKRLLGIPIYPARQLSRFLLSSQPDVLVISTIDLSAAQKQEIAEQCLKHKVKVLHVPPMSKWINGELSFRQIRALRIEDLLQRDTIQLDVEKIKNQLREQTILITGAAGSIGSEIARQVIQFEPCRLILLDQAETPLHNLELEFRAVYRFENYEVIIGDVRDTTRMQQIFSEYRPNFVYHAAAYKHVPLMEKHPQEAIRTNLRGTQNIANLAVEYQAQRFVFVSTDKAVNPTSVMGASKRLAEIYVQSLDRQLRQRGASTQFITTRFGNVLGSNGSVIPLFKKQIATGGPVTVTHPNMSRYFMTIPEACQLVLEAGTMGKGGEIFVFDMGESIKIVDLAKRMIRLSGLEVDQDISIIFTGLRPGEKLYEELLNDAERTLPTHHPKIMIAKVQEYDYKEIDTTTKEVLQKVKQGNVEEVVRLLKNVIPEFKSNNSVFEQLD